ncbi:hypothetical protein ADK43_25055 [Streptomyces rimosus subsp. rimosus]|nr:hypothetical protein ADK43_25055 [Streptomyces rimosus subsp. rimosus]
MDTPSRVSVHLGFRIADRPSTALAGREESLDPPLFEAAFCFTCHEVRIRGTAVPPASATQFFDADAPAAQALLTLFRTAAP